MISNEELDLMKRQNERNAKYLHRMGRDGVRANRHRTALLAEVDRQRAEIKRLRAEMQSAKADAWDEGYQDHQEMIEGIARKPSNPYR